MSHGPDIARYEFRNATPRNRCFKNVLKKPGNPRCKYGLQEGVKFYCNNKCF
jgi:hypothetical protein